MVDEVRIQAFEVTDPETVHRRLPLQNDIHLLKQRRQPEFGHPKALENIRLFDHPHLVSAPVTPHNGVGCNQKARPLLPDHYYYNYCESNRSR